MNWLRREGTGRYLNEAGLTGVGLIVGATPPHFLSALLATWRGRELLHTTSPPVTHPTIRLRLMEPIDNAPLDFAYLGESELTSESLSRWSGRVKPGGLVGGSGYVGVVKQRVDAHFPERAVGFTALDPDAPDWFIRMPHGSPPAADRITMVTAYDPGFAPFGDISKPNKEAYCRRHGYRFICRTDGFDPARPVSWSKLRFVRDALQDAEWVFWTDADSLVMNSAVPLSRFCWDCYDLVLSGDPYHAMNLGCWFARRTDWTFDFFDRLEAMTECLDHNWWENGAVLSRYAGDPLVRSRIGLLPNKLFNAYPYPGGGYEAGDFLIHFPGLDRVRREAAMREYAGRAV
ncbi:MAG: hypothetical protein U0791_13610 [Gemmataceae bacterium]